ncbi:MAG: AAA family ATPase [Pirellulaceae bacterium]
MSYASLPNGRHKNNGIANSNGRKRRRGEYNFALDGGHTMHARAQAPIKMVLDRLDRVSQSGSNQWSARCPAHHDNTPSLSVKVTSGGKVLVQCHSQQCSFEAIAAAIALDPQDFFPLPGPASAVGNTPSNGGIKSRPAGKGTHERNPPHNAKEPPTARLQTAPGSKDDWARKAKEFISQSKLRQREALANDLGVSLQSLQSLGVGCARVDGKEVYTFPEHNGVGQIVGINTRRSDGTQRAIWTSGRGLYLPRGWHERRGPIFVVEGASDTAALVTMDLAAIGRPNVNAKVDYLIKALAAVSTDREIIILGEIDPKSDGRWPGRDGAEKVAEQVADALQREIRWTLPPAGSKDVRAWLKAKRAKEDDDLDFADLGRRFTDAVMQHVHVVEPRTGRDDVEFLDTQEFLDADFDLKWLVHRTLVAGQPAVMGGAHKTLKTSIAIDLIVSIASGKPFLDSFKVERRATVGVVSGESGGAVIRNTFLRVCNSKGIEAPSNLPIHWMMHMPSLSCLDNLDRLAQLITDREIEVLVLDPLYLGLLAGNPNAQASNLFDMGPLYSMVCRTCLDAGATPILVHHTSRTAAKRKGPPDLSDLAFAGGPEFARQWLLLARRNKFNPDTGEHQLWLNVGGSAGHSSLWAVDIGEGRLDDDFSGRRWDVTIRSPREGRSATDDERDDKTNIEDLADGDRQRFLDALSQHPEGETLKGIRKLADLAHTRAKEIAESLVAEGLIEKLKVQKKAGRGPRGYPGYRLVVGDASSYMDEGNEDNSSIAWEDCDLAQDDDA